MNGHSSHKRKVLFRARRCFDFPEIARAEVESLEIVRTIPNAFSARVPVRFILHP
jgi:hypothetical protein